MARDDDEKPRTARAIRFLGHGASGGHHPAPKDWDASDPEDDGDDMAYQFQEYPKHVTVDGKLFVCNDEEEELQALETGSVVRDADERVRLLKVAEVKGVQVDGRWSLARITKAISDAGFDPALNPFA